MIEFLQNLLDLSLEAAPWLVLGLVIGGLIKALVPISFLQKHLGGSGFLSIIKAALFGAPLPLCSCGVIPAALGLRRAGASKSATVSFLVSTPETGVDSVTISYALLGPFMAIVRPIAAIVSAVTAGLLVKQSEEKQAAVIKHSDDHSHQHIETGKSSCCSSSAKTAEEQVVVETASCCSSACSNESSTETSSCCTTDHDEHKGSESKGFWHEAWKGIVYSFDTLFVDVFFWLVVGLIFAALVKTFVPATFMTQWGSGLPAMLIMLVIGIPMYVCATASTPIAAGLLLAGVSPGVAMVFLMAGPASNISTLGVIGKELGKQALTAYLIGVGVVALLTGYVVDYLVSAWNIDVQAQISHSQEIVPPIIAWASLLVLLAVVLKLKLGKYFVSSKLANT